MLERRHESTDSEKVRNSPFSFSCPGRRFFKGEPRHVWIRQRRQTALWIVFQRRYEDKNFRLSSRFSLSPSLNKQHEVNHRCPCCHLHTPVSLVDVEISSFRFVDDKFREKEKDGEKKGIGCNTLQNPARLLKRNL